mmetsp:Transcript_28401/g.43498  ORF Transcript_28401/g.43498 Transcript_28401/m.43498 type:complete len:496 (+) Transcript_28401:114-1601(+)
MSMKLAFEFVLVLAALHVADSFSAQRVTRSNGTTRLKSPWATSAPVRTNIINLTVDESIFRTSTSIFGTADVSEDGNVVSSITHDNLADKKILVVGGSGRVGGSVVCQLLRHNAKVTVGGTRAESFEESRNRWKSLFPSSSNFDDVPFVSLDREDETSVANILNKAKEDGQGFDLVVHTAGPFQGKVKTPNGVIAACVENGVGYIDVCDDYCTATAAKTKYTKKAIANGVPCILSTGCWPGVSSLMAKQLTQSVLAKRTQLTPADLTVDFSFFTAGSGGAGSTLLVATFLILAEESLTIVNGRRRSVKAMKEYSSVNFGKIVGNKDVAHLNLLEAASVHDALGIGNVKTLFGTAPGFWNTLLGAMAQLPSTLLSNEPIMEKLALFSLPIVRVVDYFAGATNAMRVEVSCSKDPSVNEMALYAHENLEPCVGECVVGFCAALLGDKVSSGIWFPEEAIVSQEDNAAVLGLAGVGAHTLEVQSDDGLRVGDVWGMKQ